MKKALFLLFFFINYSFCQENISVLYKVKIEDEKDLFSKNATVRGYFEKAIQNASFLEFKLICQKENSKFSVISNLTELDISLNQTLLSFSNYTGLIYEEKNNILQQSIILGNNTFIKKAIKQDWILENKSKNIDGFVCYKATTTNKITYGEKIFNHPVIAWYCPSIPYNFGPNGYSGLPGLILDLQVRNVVYGATQIDLNTAENFEIDTKKMKILNEQQYKEALDKINDF